MYDLRINEKTVSIEIKKERGSVVFLSECEGKKFYSAIAPRGEKLFLLLEREIVGVGMWSDDQTILKQMLEEYKSVKEVGNVDNNPEG